MRKAAPPLIAVFVVAVLARTASAEIITPAAAVASTEFAGVVGPGHLIDSTRLNASNQHTPRAWGGNWLSADRGKTQDHWVYIDLGVPWKLDELRIWNYHEDGGPGIPELLGRGVKACSIWVASEGAALPKAGRVAGEFKAANGWTQVWTGELNRGPSTMAPVSPIGPTNVFELAGRTGIRYVAIDIDTRWGPDAYTTRSAGLSHIQVTGKSLAANHPIPSNARRAVAIDHVLSWTPPSAYAPSGYEVYLNSDQQKVAAGDVSVKVTAADADADSANTQYKLTSALSHATPYFWRVDSIVDGKTIPGRTWSFRTRLPTNNLGFDEIVFVKRKPYSSDHNYWVVNNGTSADRFLAENGIYVYNLRTSETRPVITAANLPGGTGVVGKLSLSFDAKKVIFDYREDTTSGFRIWEVSVDGTGLRQLTFPPTDETEKVARYGKAAFHTDDMHPSYLPDGGIVFTSSRCEHGVLCFTQPEVVSVVLHRMDADGGHMTQLTQSPVSEFSPVVLDDGRIMYHRWEYVDRGARVGKTFWAMNPDGSKSEELFGLSDSEHATGAFMYAQPVPGDHPQIVCAVGPHFPQGNSVGPIKLIDLSKDTRTSAPLTNLTPDVEIAPSQGGWLFAASNFEAVSNDGVGGPLYTHPFPISASRFLVAHKEDESIHYMENGAYGIYLIDTAGNKSLIYEDEDGTVSCWHPTPMFVREVPDKIHSPRLAALQKKDQALCVVTNVYEGMEGIDPGRVKYVRVMEAIGISWDAGYRSGRQGDGAGLQASAVGHKSDVHLKKIHGIATVHADGSACFTVQPNKNLFFQALDVDYMELQRMR
ncbi:MAG: hypothetical protein CMJ48_05435, partial [Planctomycetaceae bacterium]|nr:hypothetical protein [Planctomycetaceae bacterium]